LKRHAIITGDKKKGKKINFMLKESIMTMIEL